MLSSKMYPLFKTHPTPLNPCLIYFKNIFPSKFFDKEKENSYIVF